MTSTPIARWERIQQRDDPPDSPRYGILIGAEHGVGVAPELTSLFAPQAPPVAVPQAPRMFEQPKVGQPKVGQPKVGQPGSRRPRHRLAEIPPLPLPPRTSFLRRITKHPRLRHYNRLIVLTLLVNVAAVVYGTRSGNWWGDDATALTMTSHAVLANFALAILIRQQYVVNLLFWLATRAPTSWPLRIRWTLGKVYHFGGLHVGGAVAGTAWFLAHVGFVSIAAVKGGGVLSPATIGVTYALAAVLVGVVLTALPRQRVKHHDRFELFHRFGGWTALALFWAHALLSLRDLRSAGPAAGEDGPVLPPTVEVLIVLTVSIALPWLRLRRVTVEIARPSSHVAIARFDHGVTPFAGSSTTITTNPLRDWHAFANLPTPGRTGFRLAISRAGDWTGDVIDTPPSRLWVKGIPTAGVARIETLFTRVVYIATGSGVGPCLPHLLTGKVPAHLVWATRSPRKTYGDALVDEILAAQPDALIWDTSREGKPDMVQLAYESFHVTGAEAVICISNKKLTWEVVQGLEERGVPAYGAIWDS